MDKLTKGGPGDNYLGDGKVDTSAWFTDEDHLFNQVKNEDIWFCPAPFSLIYTNTDGQYFHVLGPNQLINGINLLDLTWQMLVLKTILLEIQF